MLFRSHLSTYCPHCRRSFNTKNKGEEWLRFKGVFKGKEMELKLSPYLDVFERGTSVPIEEGEVLSDLICPYCNTSLVVGNRICQECGSQTGEMILSAFSRLIPFYICLRHGCEWHGLTMGDEQSIKLKIPRQGMPEQDSRIRVRNFREVPLGYTSKKAILEAGRCLQCTNPQCVTGCPVNVDIPAFIKCLREDRILDAASRIKEKNILPAVCGRVCPQEEQCEEKCVMGIRDKPVAIGNLERYVADYEREIGNRDMPENLECNGKKVAVVGSGPGGLTCAADLVAKGYEVTVFEAFHEAGGVLKYGIPEFRLPKEIVQNEIDYLKEMGCRIELNHIIGNIYTLEELREKFDAVYIGVGAGLPRFLNIEGENLNYVMSANEYLTRINLMKAYKFPEVDTPLPHGDKITVVGGGNVAMDSARSALRSGAKSVTVVYRRSREEMPARNDEIVHAEEEGVNFVLLSNPVRLIGDRRGRVKSMECQKMRLSEPDGSGRRKPIPIEGHNFFLDTDLVIIAVGTNANPLIFRTSPELKFTSP